MQPQKIGRPNVTPERPIMNRNRAYNLGLFAHKCKPVVGAVHMDGDHAYLQTTH